MKNRKNEKTKINREAKIVKLKLDVIFKRIFGDCRNEQIIRVFLSSLLDIPVESIKSISIENIELPPEYLNQKFSKLDLKLIVNDKIIDLEMQLGRMPGFNERALYYGAKLYSDQLATGEEYKNLNQTICINIVGFDVFEFEDYHSCYMMQEVKRHDILTDRMIMHFFELNKVKNSIENAPVIQWLKLINAETEGELMDIEATTNIPEIQETIVKLRQLSGDEKVRREAFLREKRLHDEASFLGGAKSEGIEIGREIGKIEGIKLGRAEGREIGVSMTRISTAKSLIKMGLLSFENISEATGLSVDEITKLAKEV